jgi:DNA-binding LytR/AlgR family response regulator
MAPMPTNIYKCAIVDDEHSAIEIVEAYIKKSPGLVLIRSYTDPEKALIELLSSDEIDVLFCDIDMPALSGIDLALHVRHKINKLVFITAHTKYGYEAFGVKADAYLLKPFDFIKFTLTIRDIFPPLDKQRNPAVDTNMFFFIKSKEDNHRMIKIKYEDVVLVESKQNYVLICTMTQNILTYMSLSEIYKILCDRQGFARFHRSFIISLNHIVFIEGPVIKMANGTSFTIGDHFRKEFNEFLSGKLLRPGQQ